MIILMIILRIVQKITNKYIIFQMKKKLALNNLMINQKRFQIKEINQIKEI